MNASASLDEVLTAVSRILLWCFVLSILLLLFWFVFFLAAGDFAYRFHAKMFDLSKDEFDVINYCGMGLVKACSFMLFFIPWVATRLALSGGRKLGAAQTR